MESFKKQTRFSKWFCVCACGIIGYIWGSQGDWKRDCLKQITDAAAAAAAEGKKTKKKTLTFWKKDFRCPQQITGSLISLPCSAHITAALITRGKRSKNNTMGRDVSTWKLIIKLSCDFILISLAPAINLVLSSTSLNPVCYTISHLLHQLRRGCN